MKVRMLRQGHCVVRLRADFAQHRGDARARLHQAVSVRRALRICRDELFAERQRFAVMLQRGAIMFDIRREDDCRP